MCGRVVGGAIVSGGGWSFTVDRLLWWWGGCCGVFGGLVVSVLYVV